MISQLAYLPSKFSLIVIGETQQQINVAKRLSLFYGKILFVLKHQIVFECDTTISQRLFQQHQYPHLNNDKYSIDKYLQKQTRWNYLTEIYTNSLKNNNVQTLSYEEQLKIKCLHSGILLLKQTQRHIVFVKILLIYKLPSNSQPKEYIHSRVFENKAPKTLLITVMDLRQFTQAQHLASCAQQVTWIIPDNLSKHSLLFEKLDLLKQSDISSFTAIKNSTSVRIKRTLNENEQIFHHYINYNQFSLRNQYVLTQLYDRSLPQKLQLHISFDCFPSLRYAYCYMNELPSVLNTETISRICLRQGRRSKLSLRLHYHNKRIFMLSVQSQYCEQILTSILFAMRKAPISKQDVLELIEDYISLQDQIESFLIEADPIHSKL